MSSEGNQKYCEKTVTVDENSNMTTATWRWKQPKNKAEEDLIVPGNYFCYIKLDTDYA
jgi:hypothetical protein